MHKTDKMVNRMALMKSAFLTEALLFNPFKHGVPSYVKCLAFFCFKAGEGEEHFAVTETAEKNLKKL